MAIRARSKIWLEDDDGTYLMGPRTARLLLAIDDTGSLRRAAENAGFSYRAAWDRLRRVEEAVGYTLVETTVGGPGGGGTVLSAAGRALVHTFLDLEQQTKRLVHTAYADETLQELAEPPSEV